MCGFLIQHMFSHSLTYWPYICVMHPASSLHPQEAQQWPDAELLEGSSASSLCQGCGAAARADSSQGRGGGFTQHGCSSCCRGHAPGDFVQADGAVAQKGEWLYLGRKRDAGNMGDVMRVHYTAGQGKCTCAWCAGCAGALSCAEANGPADSGTRHPKRAHQWPFAWAPTGGCRLKASSQQAGI